MGEQIERQWSIVRLLVRRGEGYSLKELAERTGVSERTIQRDLEILSKHGFPLGFEVDDDARRFYRLPKDWIKSGELTLSLEEIASLQLARRMLLPLSGTHFEAGFQSLVSKLQGLMPEKLIEYFAERSGTLAVRPIASTDYSGQRELIEQLDRAACENLLVEIRYYSFWRREEYTTLYNPYGMVLYQDDLFLVGYSHRAEEERMFKVSRIREAHLTQEHFERPESLRLDAFFSGTFGIVSGTYEPTAVEVCFTRAAAAIVQERIWHDSQHFKWLAPEPGLFDDHPEDRPLMATFELTDVIEFKRWLKGFGDQAEILSPAWLRDQVRGELLDAARKYGPLEQ